MKIGFGFSHAETWRARDEPRAVILAGTTSCSVYKATDPTLQWKIIMIIRQMRKTAKRRRRTRRRYGKTIVI